MTRAKAPIVFLIDILSFLLFPVCFHRLLPSPAFVPRGERSLRLNDTETAGNVMGPCAEPF